MIEFEGKLSEKCCKYLAKEIRICKLIVPCPMATVFFAIITICLLKIFPEYFYIDLLIGIGIWVGTILFLLISPIKSEYDDVMPIRVAIRDDGVISAKSKIGSETKYVKNVKKVIDFGEGYFFKFYGIERTFLCLCQKDLISKGSIKKFEELFEGKIERVKDKKQKDSR